MKHEVPKELLFFPEIGKVEIVRTKSKKSRINQNRSPTAHREAETAKAHRG